MLRLKLRESLDLLSQFNNAVYRVAISLHFLILYQRYFIVLVVIFHGEKYVEYGVERRKVQELCITSEVKVL